MLACDVGEPGRESLASPAEEEAGLLCVEQADVGNCLDEVVVIRRRVLNLGADAVP